MAKNFSPNPKVKRSAYFRAKTNDRGLIVVYYGEGKGKTSAALGAVLRASGYNLETLIIQFIKGPWISGERKAIEKFLPKAKIEALGQGFVGILGDQKPKKVHKKAANEAFEKAEREIKKGKWDLIVLDEILGALERKLLEITDVLKLIKGKPKKLDLILTGRPEIKPIIKVADLVTEMKKIKHPFDKGILAKRGIDF